MRTTLEIPDDVFKKAKLKAVHEGVPLKVVFTRALQREVEEKATAAVTRSRPWKVPVAPRDMGWRGLSPGQIKQIMDDEMDEIELQKLKGGHVAADAQH